MKQLLVLLILVLSISIFAQTKPADSTVKPAKETETNSPSKSTDAKEKEEKSPEVNVTTKETTPVKKELPPLEKDGGFLVLNGIKWQSENITKMSYRVAKEACEKDGMRLPTREELIDAYYSKYPEFRTPSGYYVSGNRRASNRSHIWFVNFDNGHHNHGPLTREFNVRCVKVEPKEPAEPAKSTEEVPAAAESKK